VGEIYFDDIKNYPSHLAARPSVISSNMIFAGLSEKDIKSILAVSKCGVVLEDLGDLTSSFQFKLRSNIDVYVPYTSFDYESDRLLAKISQSTMRSA
jgi:hypothetical protein